MSDELAEIYALYRARLGEEAKVLAALLERVAAHDADAHAELAKFLHRLRGTAGTYELNDVADLATDLEKRVRAHSDITDVLDRGKVLIHHMRAAASSPS